MNESWKNYSAKFLTISPREQYLILFAGLFAIIFLLFTFGIEENANKITRLEKQINQAKNSINTSQSTIDVLQQSLNKDPNIAVEKQISIYAKKLSTIDDALLLLTSDLINPIQMRFALIDLLKTQPTVSLLSFEVIEAQPIKLSNENEKDAVQSTANKSENESKPSLVLYKHGIKLTLKGSYFQLRDYLKQLEKLEWKFFWKDFDYQLKAYPHSELKIEMYSLSTKQEFIGV